MKKGLGLHHSFLEGRRINVERSFKAKKGDKKEENQEETITDSEMMMIE